MWREKKSQWVWVCAARGICMATNDDRNGHGATNDDGKLWEAKGEKFQWTWTYKKRITVWIESLTKLKTMKKYKRDSSEFAQKLQYCTIVTMARPMKYLCSFAYYQTAST